MEAAQDRGEHPRRADADERNRDGATGPLLRLAMQALSGSALGGLLAKVIVEALRRTGVLDQFAIERNGVPTQALERRVAS